MMIVEMKMKINVLNIVRKDDKIHILLLQFSIVTMNIRDTVTHQ